MTQRRLPLPSVESLSDDQRRVYDAIESGPRGTVPALFMAFLHNAELADRIQALGALLRYQTSLEPRLSELAILAIAATGRASTNGTGTRRRPRRRACPTR